MAPYVDWDSAPIAMSADEALAAMMEVGGGDGAGGALSEAMTFLQEELGAADRGGGLYYRQTGQEGGHCQAYFDARPQPTWSCVEAGRLRSGREVLPLTSEVSAHRVPRHVIECHHKNCGTLWKVWHSMEIRVEMTERYDCVCKLSTASAGCW